MNSLFELQLKPAKGARQSGRNIYEQLRTAIIGGRLAAGARLPGTRQAGLVFGVSRNTATEIYERLANEGYLIGRRGSGTFVAETLPLVMPPRHGTLPAAPDPRLNPFWLSADATAAIGFWRDAAVMDTHVNRGLSADFRPALIDSRLFPLDLFRQVSVKQLRRLETRPPTFKSPQGNQGNFHLREAIVRHIALTRAVPCLPDDLLVTSGAQQAFDLIARILVTPGETVVAMEDPGYPPMRVAFAAAGARIVPVGVDAEGLIVEQLPIDANLICVCPSHQFPTGVTMSADRRAALVAFARAHGAVIVEDDYDGEFRYEEAPLEALRTTDAADIVFYVGTFSKCMLPSLRLGFIAAPRWAMPTLVAAKNCLDWHCPVPIQLGVSAFITDGHLARHVRRMRGLYDQRRRRITTFIGDHLSEWLEVIPAVYGMHVAAFARRPLDCEGIATRLLSNGVKLHALDRYYLGPRTRQGFVFGYGAVNLDEIDYGLAALHEALPRTI